MRGFFTEKEKKAWAKDTMKRFPPTNLSSHGPENQRRPVQTLYGGAHLFSAETSLKMGALAVKHWGQMVPNPQELTRLLGIEAALAPQVHQKVMVKLAHEAVEDLRIDFEDGLGPRSDEEEDQLAEAAAVQTALGMEEGKLPPFMGIRIRPMDQANHKRSLRTLEIYLATLLNASKGKLPEGFVVTLPKVSGAASVSILVSLLAKIERKASLPAGALKIEVMLESPEALFDGSGKIVFPAILKAAKGRCVAIPFGTYDYTGSLGVVAGQQRMDHPLCNFALHLAKTLLGAAGEKVVLSDGATNLLPLGDDPLVRERAWKLSFANIQNSLKLGIWQGWDLHPFQLPVRYAALYAFFLSELEGAGQRAQNFHDRRRQATLSGGIFDDEASVRGLVNLFRTGLSCGAFSEQEVGDRLKILSALSS